MQWDDSENQGATTDANDAGNLPTPPARRTDPITDPNDPRLSDPAYASDPQVLAFLNGIYGPGGTAFHKPTDSPGWNPVTQSWTPAATTPGGGGGGSSTLPPGSIGSLLAPFPGKAPDYVDPQYPTAPTFPTLPDWRSPTADEAAQLPGYKFARDQALEGLDLSAAARGVTNTGGTLQDIIKFGDQFAGQNYQTARQNSLDDYQTNLASKYLLPYQAAYQTWGVQNPQAGIDAQNKNSFNWNNYLQGYNIFRNQQNDSFNKLFGVAQLGAGLQ